MAYGADDKKTWMAIETNKYSSIGLLNIKDKEDKISIMDTDMAKLFTTLGFIDGSEYSGNETIDEAIGLEEILDGNARSIIFHSSPGFGQSSTLCHIVRTLVEPPQKDNKEEPKYQLLINVKSFFYITPPKCKDSLDATVMSALEDQSPNYRDEGFKHYKTKPEETAIIFDSLDEVCKNEKLIGDLMKEMETNKRVIIAGCRSREPVIDHIIHASHVKHVSIIGFDPEGISSYIEKFFLGDNLSCSAQDDSIYIVNDFKQSIKDDEGLLRLLRHPMSLYLVCVLIKAGKYSPKLLGGLTKIKIFSDIEELVLKREGLKPESDTLRKFHKYAFCAMAQGTGFYQKQMKDLGINTAILPFVKFRVEDVTHHIVFWIHRSYIEYSAAKYILNCKEKKREEILLCMAANQNLFKRLIHILEMIEPKEELLIKVIHYVLALQPHFKPPKHSWLPTLFCHTKGSEHIHKEVCNPKIISQILTHSDTVFKTSVGKVQPCVHCWRKLNFASSSEGLAVIQNCQTCLETCPEEDGRERVYLHTIKPYLPERVDDDGLDLVVPYTDRCIKIRKGREGVIAITANRPTDLVTARIYHWLGTEKLQTLMLDLTQVGDVLGDVEYPSIQHDWKLMLDDFIKNSTHLTEEGSLHFLSENDDLLRVIPNHLKDLIDHGVKDISMKVKEDYIMSGKVDVREILECGQEVIHIDGWLHIESPGHVKRIDGVLKLVPVLDDDSLRWVRIEEEDRFKLMIFSQQPEDVIIAQAFKLHKNIQWQWLKLYINQHKDNNIMTRYNQTSEDTWRQVLKEIGPHGTRMPGDGWLSIYHEKHPSPTQEEVSCYDYDSLLEVLPGLITQFHDGGVSHIYLFDGRLRGQSVVRFLEELRKTWDVSVSTSGFGVGVHIQGTMDRLLDVMMHQTFIRVNSEREKWDVECVTRDLDMFRSEKWVIIPE